MIADVIAGVGRDARRNARVLDGTRNRGETRRGARIEADAPARLETPAPAARIAAAIRAAGLPARVSRTAGAYLCNHLYFGALRLALAGGAPSRIVFLHLPATPAQMAARAGVPSLPTPDAAHALAIAARLMIEEA